MEGLRNNLSNVEKEKDYFLSQSKDRWAENKELRKTLEEKDRTSVPMDQLPEDMARGFRLRKDNLRGHYDQELESLKDMDEDIRLVEGDLSAGDLGETNYDDYRGEKGFPQVIGNLRKIRAQMESSNKALPHLPGMEIPSMPQAADYSSDLLARILNEAD